MFPDLITPASDFEHQLGACVNAMSQEDAIGQILVFERMSGTLHMRHIASADLVDTDV
ncbi:TPA: uridylate kinase, partial [Pseudomonas aeruginosa]|nr:uridylate kinase [Pseudomonas aeruginosa]HCE6675535.1 uridylate kinase [Pseudomonas aeruginosa]HEF5261445.1 uridylate kinase [Pseudomonas aeruginosa]HEH9504799.1 uridylate kinase [Pseudomonas aeruginosa]HEH9567891.1 uridylate kinase [Pseudomonas aeruginosa]